MTDPNELIKIYMESGLTRKEAIIEARKEIKERKAFQAISDIKSQNDYMNSRDRDKWKQLNT